MRSSPRSGSNAAKFAERACDVSEYGAVVVALVGGTIDATLRDNLMWGAAFEHWRFPPKFRPSEATKLVEAARAFAKAAHGYVRAQELSTRAGQSRSALPAVVEIESLCNASLIESRCFELNRLPVNLRCVEVQDYLVALQRFRLAILRCAAAFTDAMIERFEIPIS